MKRLLTSAMCAAVLAISTVGSAFADDPVRTIYDIELQPDARIHGGMSAFLQGTATPYGHQFQVQGTELDQPIAVGLYTKDPSHPLRLRVVKDSFMKPERELTTGSDGRIDLHFRTYDGFKLWIAAEQPTDYQLVVWVGDEMPSAAAPPSAVVPASEFVEPPASTGAHAAGTGGAWTKREMGMAAVLCLLLLVGAGTLFLRRKPAGGR